MIREGLKIMTSEESFKVMNLVYVGSVFHYSEESSKEDGHQFLCSLESIES